MKAILVNMDGVIIDSEPLRLLAAKNVLKKLNVETTDEYIESFAGITNTVMWKGIIEKFNIQKTVQEILNVHVSTEIKLLKNGNYTAISGIDILLKNLFAQDIPVCVVSFASSIFIKEILKKLKLEKYVTLWLSGENIEKNMTEENMFLQAVESLEIEPEDCIVLEATRSGVIAAKKIGMKCVGYQNADATKQDLGKADLVITSISELTIEMLEKLKRK